jgi:tungstate transport system substrate-binding protein
MAMALRHADELQAYTLTDEATFWQLDPEVDLEVLYRGDPRLQNVYSVIYPPDDPSAANFGDWLVAGEGRALIGNYTIVGKQAFELIPTK